MNTTAATIATIDQFKKALLSLRDKGLPSSHLTMLQAQAKAEDGMITSAKLAEVADYENYNAANLQYGTLGFNLGAFIDYTPPKRKNGTLMWWTVLSYSIDDNAEAQTGHFQFVMRPELKSALREIAQASCRCGLTPRSSGEAQQPAPRGGVGYSPPHGAVCWPRLSSNVRPRKYRAPYHPHAQT